MQSIDVDFEIYSFFAVKLCMMLQMEAFKLLTQVSHDWNLRVFEQEGKIQVAVDF